MNGLTSRPRGLAIVIRTIGVTCRAQTISPAHMAGIIVAGTHFAYTLQRLLLGRHGIGVGEELTSLLRELAFAGLGERPIAVADLCRRAHLGKEVGGVDIEGLARSIEALGELRARSDQG